MAEEKRPLVSGKYLEYLNKPLVREGDTICYGDMTEPCILILEIFSYNKETGVPENILVQVIDSKDPNKILKQGQKKGLTEAFTTGTVWLDICLKQAEQAG